METKDYYCVDEVSMETSHVCKYDSSGSTVENGLYFSISLRYFLVILFLLSLNYACTINISATFV